MRTVAGLRNKDAVSPVSGFDEVMGADISHDLSTGEDLDMDFLFDLMALLDSL